MIRTIKQDITTVTKGMIAHGVNCQGAMGSGVALAIKTKWPQIYVSYLNYPTGHEVLGSADVITVGEDLHVANCYTQEFYGPGDKRYASPEAIRSSLEGVITLAGSFDVDLYLPMIGAGLGGLDWETDVLPILEDLDNANPNTDIYVCVI